MSESASSTAAVDSAPAAIESPPPSPTPAREASLDDPRTRLHQLAAALIRTQNRRLLIEYLQLRRSLR